MLIAGHSGAYKGLACSADHGGLDAELAGVCLLDSSYGNLDMFVNWVQKHPKGRFFSIFTDHLSAQNVYLFTHMQKFDEHCTLQIDTDATDDLLARLTHAVPAYGNAQARRYRAMARTLAEDQETGLAHVVPAAVLCVQPEAITNWAMRRATSTVDLFPVTCRVMYAPSMIRQSSLASERGSDAPASTATLWTRSSISCLFCAAATWAGSCGRGNSIATFTKIQPWKLSDSTSCSTTSRSECSCPSSGGPSPFLHERRESLLQPTVLIFQGGKHQVFLAFEMLVESRLADPHVCKNLIDSHVAKSVAIKTTNCRFDQSLSRGIARHFANCQQGCTSSQPSVYHESTLPTAQTTDNVLRSCDDALVRRT